MLRIGVARDLLVVVQVDTEAGLDRVQTLFQPWVELQPAAELLGLEPLFSVRLAPVEGGGVGPKPVPQLRYGATVMMRSREPDDVLRALAQVLGGAHEYRRDDGRLWMGLRVFARGSSAVLVDLDRPALVNDPALAKAGVHELAAWSTVIQDDGSVTIPPPLPTLSWDAMGVKRPAEEWQRYELAGIAVLTDAEPTTAELLADVARRSIDGRWFTQVAAMAEAGNLAHAADRAELRTLVKRLAGVPMVK